jgi:hypothetical protein
MLARSPRPRRRQGFFTGMAAILFCAGVLLLFFALYHQGMWAALLVSALMFIGTVICWICSAILASAT